MKITKLNSRGFSHELVIVAVVALSAILGVGYMVGSHADSCTTVICNTDNPNSGVGKNLTGCIIKNVPRSPRHGASIKPTVVVYNRELAPFTPQLTSLLQIYGGQNGDKVTGSYTNILKPAQLAEIAPGKSAKAKITYSLTASYKTDARKSAYYEVSNSMPAFKCSAKFKFPTQKTKSTPPATNESSGGNSLGGGGG